MFFKQCQLRRLTPDGPAVQEFHTAWIPEEFAKRGKYLDLFDADTGVWEMGWEVVDVYTRMSEEYVREHQDDHKHQHKASDKLTPNKGLGIKR